MQMHWYKDVPKLHSNTKVQVTYATMESRYKEFSLICTLVILYEQKCPTLKRFILFVISLM